MRRSSKPQRSAAKAAKGKSSTPAKSGKYAQATGGWSPFAAPAKQMDVADDVADDVEYDAFDRVKRGWFTNKPKR